MHCQKRLACTPSDLDHRLAHVGPVVGERAVHADTCSRDGRDSGVDLRGQGEEMTAANCYTLVKYQ
jgi:hypothetical protein